MSDIYELTETDPECVSTYNHNSHDQVQLKHHQRTLLHRCLLYESGQPIDMASNFPGLPEFHGHTFRTRVGIIGDRAGSGKSYVILALILSGPVGREMDIVKTYGNNSVQMSLSRCPPTHTNLLVVPHNLIAQWSSYILTFAPNLTCFYIKNAATLKAFRSRNDNVNNVDNVNNNNSIDLIVTTSTYYAQVILCTSDKKYNRVIFDEVDNMNIPNCVRPITAFTWFVTASFRNLINPRGHGIWNESQNKHVWSSTGIRSMGFIKSLFMDLTYTMSPRLISTLVVKNADVFVIRSMSLVPVQYRIIQCRTPKTINILNGIADKMIIEYLNAGDTFTALQYVDPSNKNDEVNIVSKLVKNIEVRIRSDPDPKNVEKLQKDVENIRERVSGTNTCCICYEDIDVKTVAPCCSNSFCFKCISKWLSKNKMCPMCKSEKKITEMYVIYVEPNVASGSSSSPTDETDAGHSKMKNLSIILNNYKYSNYNSKFLIFSSYDRALANVSSTLREIDVRHRYLKGNSVQIESTMNMYRNNDVNVLLVNPKNYGCGVNMEGTTDIIMLHKFDSEIEKQVIGRAQRVGRDKELRVWYLLYDNEYNL